MARKPPSPPTSPTVVQRVYPTKGRSMGIGIVGGGGGGVKVVPRKEYSTVAVVNAIIAYTANTRGKDMIKLRLC